MKTTKLFFAFLLTISVVTFQSCDNEPIDSDLTSNDGNGNGNGDGIGDPGGESTGDYWPMAANNSWTYDYYVDGVAEEDYTMEIDQLTTYQGNQAYLYSQYIPDGTSTDGTEFGDVSVDIYTRKNGGDYIVTVGELNADFLGIYQLSQTGYSFIILKDYFNVGDTWTSTAETITSFTSNDPNIPDIPEVSQDLVLNFEIVGKDLTVNVNGQDYSPVIKVRYNLDSQTPSDPSQTLEAETFYYFAKDVGIVKIEGTQNDVADNITSTTLQELNAYTIN